MRFGYMSPTKPRIPSKVRDFSAILGAVRERRIPLPRAVQNAIFPRFLISFPVVRTHFSSLRLLIAIVLLLAGGSARAQSRAGNQIIVKYRSPLDARKALNAYAASPSMFAINGRSATARATFAAGTGAFPKENFVTITVSDASGVPATLDALSRDGAVEYAQRNALHHVDGSSVPPARRTRNDAPQGFVPNDSAFSSQWNLERVGMPAAWEIEKGKSDVLVAFVDTGIDWDDDDYYGADGKLATVHVNPAEDINHDGLFEPWPKDSSYMYRGALRSGDLDGIDQDGNGSVDDVIGFDMVDQAVANVGDWADRDAVPYDENGHGTAIAGVIAAQANNRIGIAGVAPGCRVLPLRAFDATGNGEDDDIAAAIVYAADFQSSDGARVRVINLSFGDVIASPVMHDAIKYARSRGIVIVCSSGNFGGSNAHYPSDYAECISVGASEESDGVVGTSGGGNALALVAPGADIVTTAPGNTYVSTNGTSVAAPHVAAAAALLISHSPSLSPDDVRGILQTTAEDLPPHGWDARAGAGRLNVALALNAFAASVRIDSPKQDTGIASSAVAIRGTVALPFFAFYRVFVGAGDAPTTWTMIADTTRTQRIDDTLAMWNTAGTSDGPMVIRVVVNTSDNKIIEARSRVFVERAPAQFTQFRIFDALLNDKHVVVVDARTDQPTTMSVLFSPGATGPWQEKRQIDQFTHHHYVVLDENDLAANVSYVIHATCTNAAGITTQHDSSAMRQGDAFPVRAFVRKPYALEGSVLLNANADVYNDNGKCVAALDESVGSGMLRIAEFRNGQFETRDSLKQPFNPRGMGATRGDGLLQVWSQSGTRSVLWSQTARGGAPLHSIAFADTNADVVAAGMADLDGDGVNELVAFSGSQILVFKYQNGSYMLMARLANPTPAGFNQAENFFSYPSIATGDFDGDGKMELLVGDGDADFFIYEYDPATHGFVETFTDLNDGEDAFVTAGDFNADGKPDFAIAYHTPLSWNADREYETPYWTVKVFSSTADNTFTERWRTYISGVKPPSTYRGGMASGELDGVAGDELFVNTFPSSYVFKWDAAHSTFGALQYFPFGASNTAIVADFDGNQVNEIGFYTGNRTEFFEYDATNTAPPTPVNFTAVPTGPTTAFLQWNPSPGSQRSVVYRGKFTPGDAVIRMDSVAGTTNGFYADSQLVSRSYYAYAIVAVGAGRSVPTPTIDVYAHPPAVARIEPAGGTSVKLHFSELMPQTPVQPSVFTDTLQGAPSSVITGGDSVLVLVWSVPLGQGAHKLRIVGLRDRWGERVADTVMAYDHVVEVRGDSLYIVSTHVPDVHHVRITFSCAIDSADAEIISHYTLLPTGRIVEARRDSADHASVILTLDNNTPIGAFGKSWTIHVSGLTSTQCGRIVEGAGSTAGIVMHKEDLTDMFVYPNPCRIDQNDHCTFANLTPEAEITIFTLSGARIASVTEKNGDGGVDWNLRDQRGDVIQSGIYIYYATGKNSAGADVEPKVGKFAIVR